MKLASLILLACAGQAHAALTACAVTDPRGLEFVPPLMVVRSTVPRYVPPAWPLPPRLEVEAKRVVTISQTWHSNAEDPHRRGWLVDRMEYLKRATATYETRICFDDRGGGAFGKAVRAWSSTLPHHYIVQADTPGVERCIGVGTARADHLLPDTTYVTTIELEPGPPGASNIYRLTAIRGQVSFSAVTYCNAVNFIDVLPMTRRVTLPTECTMLTYGWHDPWLVPWTRPSTGRPRPEDAITEGMHGVPATLHTNIGWPSVDFC